MDLGLRGKRAVVSGASIGIGLGVSHAFAREGADVVMVARQADRLEAAAAQVGAEHGVRADIVVADVSTTTGCQAVIDAVSKLGGPDILVNNAGTGSNETIMEADDAKWDAYWQLHVMAAVRLARGVVPMMEARGGGAILNNASICAVQPLWYEPIYNVTKAALMMLTKTMSTEFIPQGIRVNGINPGLIRTPDWENTARELKGEGWEDYLQSVADEHAAIKRFGTVEELADFFVFLCSDRASYSVGSTYFVDGGMLKTV